MSYNTHRRDSDGADTSLEQLDSSIEMRSPSPSPSPSADIHPRKLHFVSPRPVPDARFIPADVISPPYRKVRALRLFDTPATPKTILKKSSASSCNGAVLPVPTNGVDRPRSLPLHSRTVDNVINGQKANINPFTPDSLLARNKKRCRTQCGRENVNEKSKIKLFLTDDEIAADCQDDDGLEIYQAPKRLALQETNISRYGKEFVELSLIGIGEFGLVYQCLNRLDGCTYAIKKSIKPVAGSSFEKRALNEVWAHAVLGKHDNVVRYYSAWAEDNHMLIQNEYCNGGSLQSLIQQRFLTESELKTLVLHVAEGLRYIHSNDLVHMDLKSGNIFLTKVLSTQKALPPPPVVECDEDGLENIYAELGNSEYLLTYKIGDLGHVTSVNEPSVEEGDCRYLPNEILQENYSDLFKADIFSLGITLYEAAGGAPLPKNGPEWHQLRQGKVPYIPTISADFNDLIKQMTHPDPEKRPTSTTIFGHPILNSMNTQSKTQLSQALIIERRKNEILMRKLRETRKQLKAYEAKAKQLESGSPQSADSSTELQRCLRSRTRKMSETNAFVTQSVPCAPDTNNAKF